MSAFESPYPGLRSFTRDEDVVFFGRDEHIDALLEKLHRTRFLPVVGPSGCGKSSLIRAGLMASLEGGLMDETGAHWEMAEMRPGKHPYAALAQALAREKKFRTRFTPDDPLARAGFLSGAVRESPLGLTEILQRSGLPARTNFLLLVDQFEEIFAGPEDRNRDDDDAFVAMLLASAAQSDLPIYVVITMRTDYLGDCAIFPGLAEAINNALFLTPRLTREQREQAILSPARMMGGEIEPELLNELLNQTAESPDQLPLMQHLLSRMWCLAVDARNDDPGSPGRIRLTQREYKAAGGLGKALSLHAGAAYRELTCRQQEIAQVLFRLICERCPDGRERRRLVAVKSIAELAGAGVPEVIAVADVFRRPGRNFLVPPLEQPLSPETDLDISHEALIRNWDQLGEWAKAEADSAEMYRDLEKAARKHQAGRGGLWRRPELDSALAWKKREGPSEKWAARYGGNFPLAMDFLRRSERRRTRKRAVFYGLVFCGVLLASLVAAGGYAYRKHEAEKLTREEKTKFSKAALSRGLGRLESKTFDPRANAYALREFGRAVAASPENTEAARHAANLLFCNWCPPLTPALTYKPDAPLLAAIFTSNDEFCVVARDGYLLTQSAQEDKLQAGPKVVDRNSLPKGMTDLLCAASFSPDAQRLVVVPASKEAELPAIAQIWKLEGRTYVYDQTVTLSDSASDAPSFRPCVWSPDQTFFVTSMWRPGAPSYDVFRLGEKGKFESIRDRFPNGITAADFDATGTRLAVADSKGNIQLWPVQELARPQSDYSKVTNFPAASQNPCLGLKFMSAGRQLIVTRFGNWGQIDLSTGTPSALFPPPTTQDQFMRFVAPSREGTPIHFALALANRVVFAESDSPSPNWRELAEYPIYEPLCIRGTSAFPVFNASGSRLLTLSGAIWTAMDHLRVWDVSMGRAAKEDVTFDGKDAPEWLAPLALAVAGLRVGSDDDDEKPAQTLQQVRESARKQGAPAGQYAPLWRRYFGD
jgi:hypothetical protein